LRELLERLTVKKQAGVEEVRRQTAGFGFEFTKIKYFFRHHEANEFVSEIVRHELSAGTLAQTECYA
jgi:hypothetical protein